MGKKTLLYVHSIVCIIHAVNVTESIGVCICCTYTMKGELWKAGCCGGFVAQWLWWLQPDTPGASPSTAGFFFAFLLSLQQVDFQLIALHTYTIHVNQTKN